MPGSRSKAWVVSDGWSPSSLSSRASLRRFVQPAPIIGQVTYKLPQLKGLEAEPVHIKPRRRVATVPAHPSTRERQLR
jgi:hypothetical protein